MLNKYHVITLLLIIGNLLGAQTKVSINNSTVTISPNYTVTNVTPIKVSGQVKNVGTTTITANVHINMAIDTSSTSVPKYFIRSTSTNPVVGFVPNAIFNFTVTDVADSGNGYKIAGNGTTIVVWTVVGLASDTTALDSVFTNLYIVDITGIEDWNSFENQVLTIKNPVTESVLLNFDRTNFSKVELINTEGQMIDGALENGYLSISTLSKGMYYLVLTDKKNKKYIKKIIIN